MPVGPCELLKIYASLGNAYGLLILVKYTRTAGVDNGIGQDQGRLKL